MSIKFASKIAGELIFTLYQGIHHRMIIEFGIDQHRNISIEIPVAEAVYRYAHKSHRAFC